MKILVALCLLIPTISFAQKISSEDKKTLANLKTNITFLSSDKLEGRRTGTKGEKLAYEYIQIQLKKLGLQPYAANKSYVQQFAVKEGKEITTSSLKINGTELKINKEYFPLAYSGKIYNTTSLVTLSVQHRISVLHQQ